METSTDPLAQARDLRGMCEAYPAVCNEPRIRHQLRHRNQNGLAASGAISKRAGVWLFMPDRYFAWLFSEKAAA
jgi:hypothetical protein